MTDQEIEDLLEKKVAQRIAILARRHNDWMEAFRDMIAENSDRVAAIAAHLGMGRTTN